MQKRKIISVLVASCMLGSMAACSKTSKNDKAVIEAANEYAEALLDLKAKNVANLTDGGRDVKSELEIMFDFETFYGPETGSVYSAIVEAMTFEVDEDSVDTDSEDGQIDIVFTMPDYEDVADDEDNMVSPDAFIDALEDADTIDVTVTFEFELDDGTWLVTNHSKAIPKVFPFLNSDIEFAPDLVSAFSGFSWYNSSNGVYTNADYINFWGQFSDVGSSDINIYFTVERDGVLIHTSDIVHSGDYYYRATDDPDSESGCLPAGTYTITCYQENGTQIATGTCTVIFDVNSAPNATDYFSYESWYGSYSIQNDGTVIYTDATYLDLDLHTTSTVEGYYTIEYYGVVIYTSEVEVSTWFEGYYNEYHCGDAYVTEDNGYIPSGEYTISFYTTAGNELIYAHDVTVINTDYPAAVGIGGAADDGRGDDEIPDVDDELGTEFLYDATIDWSSPDSIEPSGLANYTNPSMITCTCNMSSAVDCYSEVYYLPADAESLDDAELVHTYDPATFVSSYGCILRTEDAGSYVTADGKLQDGFYLFIFGTTDNDVIAYGMCFITND